MDKRIDYFFTPISGYAYLGHQALHEICTNSGATINYCPIDIVKVFNASGTTPPAKQSTARKTYRQEDMARLAEKYSVPIKTNPKYWPAHGELASRVIIASGDQGLDQHTVCGEIMKGIWALDANIADRDELQSLLIAANLPGQQLVEASDAESITEALDQLTDDAIEKAVFGSPTYFYDGTRYWGQDRLDVLSAQLK